MDLQGDWWVISGHHPVYDCYPCQHLFFSQINETAWKYVPEYQVYLVNGSLGLFNNQVLTMPNSALGEGITFSYHDLGFIHHETWYLMKHMTSLTFSSITAATPWIRIMMEH